MAIIKKFELSKLVSPRFLLLLLGALLLALAVGCASETEIDKETREVEVEVLREVPVEVTREVPVEVTREVEVEREVLVEVTREVEVEISTTVAD